ncbi:MerR family transcriptional regulator [Flocculibacter collagenilyticus]|uniref:MerR family transcriptional regulator n=1 Tax=Flocculibacter collagenilyticus TaxID=2744479 RepID=UPI0018F703B5|nr:MerR family DNA-binding transcriptional regulator [Flocculibacter collagenilyticus]
MTSQQEITFSISDLAKEFDITTRSIRFYEDQGLLMPSRSGQTRIYSKRDRVRLKLILRGKRLGFSLAETKNLFELYDADQGSAIQLETMLTMIQEKKERLHQQMDDIKVVLMELITAERRCLESLTNLSEEFDVNIDVNNNEEKLS